MSLHVLDEEYGAGARPGHLACVEIKLSRRVSATAESWLVDFCAGLVPLCIAFVSKMKPPPRLPVIGTTSLGRYAFTAALRRGDSSHAFKSG